MSPAPEEIADQLLQGMDFSQTMRDVDAGLLVKPALSNFLYDPDFAEEFVVHFKSGDQNRPANGWFWPSTHPTWPAKALYHYLVEPQHISREHRTHANTLSLTFGTAMHGFIEMCLTVMGIRPAEMNMCQMCPTRKGHSPCAEPGFKDEEVGSRGHLDGLLDLTRFKPKVKSLEYPAFEFKTSNDRSLKALETGGLDYYKARHPVYYAQNQEYMTLSGRRHMVVLFLQLGYPWRMVEIHVPYDHAHVAVIRDKYKAVRAAAGKKTPPICCGKTKSCPVGNLCSVDKPRSGSSLITIRKDGSYGLSR